MSDEPERRAFIDKLISFNEKNGIKLNTCPHISKTLIDLFKLYNYVKERGGFTEVTKKKQWKECANLIKMPIASTTSYMLRKSYIKHLLSFECYYDLNGADPDKILASLESNSKKKSAKNVSASPQPVDTNSQSSYPQSLTPQLNTSNNQASLIQSPNLQSPNNLQQSNNFHSNVPIQQSNAQLLPNHHQMSSYHLQQQQNQMKMMNNNLPPPHSNYDAYQRGVKQTMPQMQFTNQRTGLSGQQNYPSTHLPPPQTDNFQPNYQQQSPMNQNYLPNQQMKPLVMMNNSSSFPKRHADFNKIEQQSFPNNYPPSAMPTQTYPPPPNNYPSPINQSHLNSPLYPSPMNSAIQAKENYSNANEYLSNSFLNNYNKQQQQQSQIPPPSTPIPHPSHHHPRPPQTFDQNKPQSSYLVPSGQSSFYPQTTSNIPSNNIAVHQQPPPPLLSVNPMREFQFPSESIEAIKPVFIKRKRMTSKDLSQIDPWKLMMSLKSGLLAETTWALDVLSILLHDDSTYLYFSLQNLPGLLELLLEHFKLYLSEIFSDLFKDIVIKNKENESVDEQTFEEIFVQKVLEANEKFKKKYNSQIEIDDCLENGCTDEMNEKSDDENNDEYSRSSSKTSKRIKLTKLDTLAVHTDHKQVILTKSENYTLKNRHGLPVYFVDDDENLFINDMSKRWDKSNRNSTKKSDDVDNWKRTFFSSTDFIQRTIQPPDNSLLFARNLKASQLNDENNDEVTVMTNGINETHKNSKENSLNDRNDESNDETSLSTDRIYPRFREKIKSRKFLENHENEAYNHDSPPLCSLNDYRESIAQKCICFSNLIRNLSFIPGNDVILVKNRALLLILGRLLLLHHKHLEKKSTSKLSLDDNLFNENDELDKDDLIDSKDDQQIDENHNSDDEWWWEALHFIRENALVILANISGSLNLSKFNEDISLPIFSGLLHWMICPSAMALDNFFKTSSITTISPSRLSLECLAKLSILDDNVDLILSTPPYNRDFTIYETLVNYLRKNEDQTLREFALVLIYNFAIADPNIARTIALSTDAIQQLIVFIELAEQNALNIINTQGKKAFKENPEAIGTTLDMIKVRFILILFQINLYHDN